MRRARDLDVLRCFSTAKKTREYTILLFGFGSELTRIVVIIEVLRRAPEHRKYACFSTANKTRENTMNVCQLLLDFRFVRVLDGFWRP